MKKVLKRNFVTLLMLIMMTPFAVMAGTFSADEPNANSKGYSLDEDPAIEYVLDETTDGIA